MAKKPSPSNPLSPRLPLRLTATKRYMRDAALARKRKLDMTQLTEIVNQLRNRQPLAGRHRDHPLTGDWIGFRECHIRPDWLLIYHIDAEDLVLDRTGTHADLFG